MSSPLQNVEFRAATQEDKQVQGGWLYWAATFIPWKFVEGWGTVQYMRNTDDLLQWKEPAALKLFYRAQHYFGYKPEEPYVNVRPTLFGDHYSINDRLAVSRFFKFHRNDPSGFFAPGKGVKILTKFLMECFPGTTMEDCILTCGPGNTVFLHGLLQQKLKKNLVGECIGLIHEEARTSLAALTCGEEINFTGEAQKYLSRVFGRILFDDPKVGQELSEFIVPFKAYIARQSSLWTQFKKAIGLQNKEEIENIEKMKAKVREIIDTILERENEIELFHNNDKVVLSQAQKQMMIFVVLFAAQDNTTNLLAVAIYELTQLSEEDRTTLIKQVLHHDSFGPNGAFTYPPLFHRFFAEVLKKHPPVLGVARSISQDVCMEYIEEGDSAVKKVIFPAGSSLSARIVELAHKTKIPDQAPSNSLFNSFSPFGGGYNRCPGENLAEAEIKAYLYDLLCLYDVSLKEQYDVKLKLQFTGVLEPDIKAVLQKRISL